MTWDDFKKQKEGSRSSGASWDNYLANRSKRIEEQEQEEKERLEKQRQREEQLAKQRESVIFNNEPDYAISQTAKNIADIGYKNILDKNVNSGGRNKVVQNTITQSMAPRQINLAGDDRSAAEKKIEREKYNEEQKKAMIPKYEMTAYDPEKDYATSYTQKIADKTGYSRDEVVKYMKDYNEGKWDSTDPKYYEAGKRFDEAGYPVYKAVRDVEKYTSQIGKHKEGKFGQIVATETDAIFNTIHGALNSIEGLTDDAHYLLADGLDLMGAKDASKKVRDYAKINAANAIFGKNEKEQENFKKDWTKAIEESSLLTDGGRNVMQGVGNSLGYAALNYLGVSAGIPPKLTSLASVGLSSYGNTKSEMLANGFDNETATKAALISMLSETISENIFDFKFGMDTSGWGNELIDALTNDMDGISGQIFTNILEAGSEGSEELISDFLNTLFSDAAHLIDESYTYGTGSLWDKLTEPDWEQFLDASLSTLLVNSSSNVIKKYVSNKEKKAIINAYAEKYDMTFEDAKKFLTKTESTLEQKINKQNAFNTVKDLMNMGYTNEQALDKVNEMLDNKGLPSIKQIKTDLDVKTTDKIMNFNGNEMSLEDITNKIEEIQDILQSGTITDVNSIERLTEGLYSSQYALEKTQQIIEESEQKKIKEQEKTKQEQMVKVQEEQKEPIKDTSQDTQQLEKTIQESEIKLEELKSNQTQNEDQVKKLEQELSTLESEKENKDLAKQISKQRTVVEDYQDRFNKEQKTFGLTEDTLKLGKQVKDAKTYLQKLIDQQKQEKLNKEQKINEIKKQIEDLKAKDNTREIERLEKETETNKKQSKETEEKLSKDEIGVDIENSNDNSNELEIKNKSAIILEEMPKDMEKTFSKIKKSYETTKKNLKKISSKLINSWSVIQEMDRKRGTRSLGATLNNANNAYAMAQEALRSGVYDFKGNKLSEGVKSIFKKIDDTYENNHKGSMSKKEYRQIVGDYVYASRQATQADDRMPIIGDADTINRILEINKEIDNLSQDVGNNNDIKKLSEEKLKLTRELIEDAKEIVKEIEADYPEVKEFKNDVLNYEKALRQLLKEAGFLTQEQSDELEQAYPEYVRVYRNVKKTGEYVPKKYANMFKKSETVNINSPVYETKGSTADILPLENALIKQTENIYRSTTRNLFAKELYNAIGGLNSKIRKEAIQDGIVSFNNGDKALIFYDKGNAKVIPISNEIADAVNPKHVEFGALGKFLEKESSLTRDLITNLSPIFALRNLMSDLSDAPINSQHSALYLKNMPAALGEMMSNGKLYQQYKSMGGLSTTYFDYDKSFRQKNLATKALGAVPGAVEFLGNHLEHYTRFIEFMASIEAGDSIIEAMYNADELSVNFKKGGQWTKIGGRLGLNYINAKVLGMYKAYENIANHKGGKEMLKLITKASIFGILPSLLNELLWHDDDDYEELSDSVKNKYYVFKLGDTLYKIPKGHITRVISAIPETTFRGTLDDKSLQESLSESLSNGIDFALDETDLNNWKIWESHSLWPLVNLMINKDNATNYFGSSIIPNRYKKKDSTLEDQWNDPGVTKSSIGLSKWAKETFGWEISPFVLDYLGDQKLGVAWDFAEPLMTNEPDKMAWEAAFTADARVNNRYNDELEKRVNKTPKTDDEIVLNKYYSSKQYDMWDKYAEIRDVGQDENLSESEKREKVDEIRNRMNQIAKDTLDITDKNIVNKTVGGVKYKQINAGDEIYSYKYDEKNNTWKKVYTKK